MNLDNFDERLEKLNKLLADREHDIGMLEAEIIDIKKEVEHVTELKSVRDKTINEFRKRALELRESEDLSELGFEMLGFKEEATKPQEVQEIQIQVAV